MTRRTGEILAEAAARLDAAGIDNARLDARLLLAAALECDAADLLAARDAPLAPAAAQRFADLLSRRAGHEPVAHLLGRREFWSLPFRVTADTLIPRPDSETVVEAALATVADRDRPLRVLDLGTGTGCLLLALLSELSRAQGIGVDIDGAALAVARINAADLGLADRTRFVAADWGAGLAGKFDLIVANPPYIETSALAALMPDVRDFEPRRALDGGADGLDAYRIILPRLTGWLMPDGSAVLEIGAAQADAVAALAGSAGLAVAGRAKDLAGRPRGLVLRPLET